MTIHEVSCITKNVRTAIDERIIRIGGRNTDGSRWTLSQEEAIKAIENKTRSFFVSKGGHSVKVIVSVSRFNNKYLKTVNDGDSPDNLLSLPEC